MRSAECACAFIFSSDAHTLYKIRALVELSSPVFLWNEPTVLLVAERRNIHQLSAFSLDIQLVAAAVHSPPGYTKTAPPFSLTLSNICFLNPERQRRKK